MVEKSSNFPTTKIYALCVKKLVNNRWMTNSKGVIY